MQRFFLRYSAIARSAGLLTVVLLGTLFTGSCGDGPLVLESQWREQAIVIDGIDDEWVERVRVFKEARVVIGLMNDDEFLYVMIGTTSRTAQFHLMRGLNIWFDPEDHETKTFGIRYPVIDEELMRVARRNVEARASQKAPDPKKMAARFKELSYAMTDLEILGADGRLGRMPIDEAQGIEAKLGRKEDALIFEAKIPLAKQSRHLYSIGTAAGNRIGIGLESPKFKTPNTTMYDPMSRGAGRSGGTIGGSGDPQSRPPRDSDYPERPKPISVWASVQLATDTSTD